MSIGNIFHVIGRTYIMQKHIKNSLRLMSEKNEKKLYPLFHRPLPVLCRPGQQRSATSLGKLTPGTPRMWERGVGERREKEGHVAVNRNLCTLPAALKKRSHELLSQEEPGHRSSDRDTWQSTGKGNTVKQCLWRRFQHVCDFVPLSLPSSEKCTSKTLYSSKSNDHTNATEQKS